LILFTAIICIFSLSLFSQDYAGKGRTGGIVTDEEGNPIEGVKVKLFCLATESGFEKFTDKDGEWKGSWIKGGTWYIDFEKVGYLPKNISTEISELQKNPVIPTVLVKSDEVLMTDSIKKDFDDAYVFYEEGNYIKAIELFKKVIEDYPDAFIVNMSVGDSYFKMEEYSQAEEYYLKVLENDPENNDVKMAIGNCYGNQGDSEKALEWYKKIEIDNIKDPVVLYNIGSYFQNNSQVEEAMIYYAKALELKEDFLDVIYQLGLAHLAMGNNAGALAEFEKYLKYDPDSERADQVKGFIEYLKR
ncbi:tetratricopeptide repeat protein, partial [Acidobacteriota bacterium]